MKKKQDIRHVTIIIVTHNSETVISKCLHSIPENFKIVLVDNASFDQTIKTAKDARPDIYIIASQQNLGFGRGNNLALVNVQTKFAFLLNPDTLMQPDTIAKLLAASDKYQDAAIIAPMLFYEDGSIQKNYKNSVFARESSKSKYIRPEGDLCADFISGAAMLLRMDLFRKIGFFDPKIFLFYEDDDICLKVRAAGYSLVQTPNAQLTHLMGKSSPASFKYIYLKNWHIMWSRLYLERKYKGAIAAQKLATREIFIQFGKLLGHLLTLKQEKTIKSLAKFVAICAFTCGIEAVRE